MTQRFYAVAFWVLVLLMVGLLAWLVGINNQFATLNKSLQMLNEKVTQLEAKLNDKADSAALAKLAEEIEQLKSKRIEEGSQPMQRPIAVVETTMGTFKFELYTDKAPKTAQNFIGLANKGFYNGLLFHRVVKGFVIQGGDPNGNGSGGPGYMIKLETSPDLHHDRPGVVAMARTSDPDSAGSQFYITLAPAPLDPSPQSPGYAIFGQVIEGMEVIQAIGQVPVDKSKGDRPLEDVKMVKVTIEQPK